jgi:SHS2 domain-containing protein
MTRSGPTSGRFEVLEHTADVRLRLLAPDAAGIYRTAVRALAAVIRDRDEEPGGLQGTNDRVSAPPGTREVPVELEGTDPADLLVVLLNEVLFQLEQGNGLAVALSPRLVSDTRLSGTFALAPVDPEGLLDIKAATYSELRWDRLTGAEPAGAFGADAGAGDFAVYEPNDAPDDQQGDEPGYVAGDEPADEVGGGIVAEVTLDL